MRDLLRDNFKSRDSAKGLSRPPGVTLFFFSCESKDYTDLLLSHAQLYVFADQKDIAMLKSVAYQNIHTVLANFQLTARRTGDIIALTRYVYDNTPCKGATAGPEDGLRALVAEYIGFEMDVLMKNKDFQRLILEDGGDLLDDFMQAVMLRI